MRILFLLGLFYFSVFADEFIESLGQPDIPKETLRKIIIERKFDEEILGSTDILIAKMSNGKWGSSSIRIYSASLLLERGKINGGQALDLCTVLYADAPMLNLGPLVMQLIWMLPEEASAEEVHDAITKKGWRLAGGMPVTLEFVSNYWNYVSKNREAGRGPRAYKNQFPFTAMRKNRPGGLISAQQ